jgi:hypothetical protein
VEEAFILAFDFAFLIHFSVFTTSQSYLCQGQD